MVVVKFERKGRRIAKLPESLSFNTESKVANVRDTLSRATNLSVHRLRLTANGKVLNDKDALESILEAKTDSITVQVKDLGPQIGWRTVFMIEYFGPLVIHPLFFFAQNLIYGETFEHSMDQVFMFAFVMMHFLKREFETVAVHKFSSATMPFFNVFKNSGHYWGLSGVLLGYFCYAPVSYMQKAKVGFLFDRQQVYPMSEMGIACLGLLWTFAELSNFYTHVNLSNLRPAGTTERHIPHGYGFDWVSCPNYFFESLSWLALALISQNWSTWLFLGVATAQMWVWAVKKHRRYRKEFPDYPKDRKIYVPFII